MQNLPICRLSDFPVSAKLSSLHSSRHYFHHDYVTLFLKVISSGLEKQSIQSRLRGKKEICEEISPEVVGCCSRREEGAI